jgi:3-isopropylmalate/(R)-2-methylmalate dehydratase small subunit
MSYKGKAYKFGNDIDTDAIIPARYLNTTNRQELAQSCMEDADKTFASKVKKGDIIIAGKNFGCGSSREHAPIAIQACGVSCVIAENFARIFFRNAINIGLPIIESKEAAEGISEGDIVEVDTAAGVIRNVTTKKTFKIEKYPPFMQKIISAGGLMRSIAKR